VNPRDLDRPENGPVLQYLYVEQLPSWRESKSIWVVEGYSLSTHPDLCERVEEINQAAGEQATFRYLYGKPALLAEDGVIVAFANGTHTFCMRLPAGDCDPELIALPREPISRFPALAQKQRELDALVEEEWTRLDPFAVRVPKAEGLPRLAEHLERALERSRRGGGDQPLD
jgi:hypothetical protein